jgi:ABC-type glycerol-3-phosphate transport system substrate-binding protein
MESGEQDSMGTTRLTQLIGTTGITKNAGTMTRRRQLTQTAGVGVAGVGAALSAACSGGTQAQPQAQQGPVTIEVLTYTGIANPTGRAQWFAKTTPQNFTPQTQITVNWIEGTGGLSEKLIAMSAGGTPPDAGNFEDFNAQGLATKGLYKPLDDLIKRDKFDRGVYWKSALAMLSLKDKLYGLPNHGNFGENVMYVNLNMTRKAGIDVPLATGEWNTDQFIEMARKVTRPTDGEWGFWPPLYNYSVLTYLRLFGGDVFTPDAKKSAIETAESRAALQWVYDLQYKHQVCENLMAAGNGGGRDATAGGFKQGNQAFVNWTTGGAAEWKTPGQTAIKFDLGITLFPKHPSGRRSSVIITHGAGITGTAKQDAAWKWVQFISNKENGVQQVFGGAGSPGARPDVWEDKRLAERDPIFALSSKTFKEPAVEFLPPNGTYTDANAAIFPKLVDLWNNKVSVSDVTANIAREVNAILAR